mgnify:CR=1 FL=1
MKFSYFRIFITLFFLTWMQGADAQLLDSLKSKSTKVGKSLKELIKQPKEKNNKNAPSSQTTGNAKPQSSQGGGSFKRQTIAFPSKEYKSFDIPVYRGVPIVGTKQDSYYSLTYEFNKEGDVRNLELYRLLLEMNVLEEVYRSRESPFNKKNAGDERSRYVNQSLVKLLRGSLLSEDIAQKYFCNPSAEREKCSNYWGGNGANEFAQNKAYDDFLKSGLYETLQKKANELPLEVYFIRQIHLPTYDFDKKGFLLPIHPGNDWAAVEPLQERNIFLSMSPEEGSRLRERLVGQYANQKNMYALIKLTFYKSVEAINKKSYILSNRFTPARVADPIVEFYEDPALEKRIGQIDISGLMNKNTLSSGGEDPTSLLKFKFNDPKLRDFELIGYNKLPLIGAPTTVTQRHSLNGNKSPDYNSLYILLALSKGADLYKDRKSPLAKNDQKGPFTEAMENSNWANDLLTAAASVFLEDKLFRDLFCAKDQNCSRPASRSGGPGAWFKGPDWGSLSGGDEFTRYEAYKKFESLGLEQNILKASRNIPDEGYVIHNLTLNDYDFDKQAFLIRTSIRKYHFSEELQKHITPDMLERESLTFQLKMAPDKAREFKKEATMQKMFGVIKVKYLKLPRTRENLTNVICERQMDVYFGESLKQKFATVQLF